MTHTFTELLTTYENWSRQDAADDAIRRAESRGDHRSAEVTRRYKAGQPDGDPVEALRAGHDLTTQLQGEKWCVVRSAREHGATWEQIAAATGTSAERARAEFAERIAQYELYGSGLTDMAPYRAVM